MWNRSSFAFCALLATAPWIGQEACRAADVGKPNILVIMTDEHHAGVMGCAGNGLARTPHLDALAARGVVFDAHYCASPICTPSRQTFTTGKYVSGHHVWSNTQGVPEGTPSLARIMNEAGYESYLIGKMHYKGGMTHGYRIVSEKTGEILAAKEPGKESAVEPTPKPRTRVRAGVFQDNQGKIGEEFAKAGEAEAMDSFVDAVRRERAVAFLRNRKADAKPFFLTVGFIAPHYPLTAPAEYLARFRGRVPSPRFSEESAKRLPLNYRHLRNERKFEDVPPETVQAAVEGYYARVEWIDQEIGQLLKGLRESPAADNTVVVYVSDHGENLGEHGLWWKNSMYDASARTPLIVSWPARWRPNQRRSGACGMVDVVRTIADLGGAKAPADWKGESMALWLDDPSHPWRDLAVCEYFGGYVASGIAMIRQGDWKYVYHSRADEGHGPERELYNMRLDPQELRNLAGDPAQQERLKALHAALERETGEDPEQTEADWRAGVGPAAVEVKKQAKKQAKEQESRKQAARKPEAEEQGGSGSRARRKRAEELFDASQVMLFEDDFASGSLERWKRSLDDQYDLAEVDPERIAVVDLEAASTDGKGVRFSLGSKPGAFRSEIALPHEPGFQERWYAAKLRLPNDWAIDRSPGSDIVMQWHAIPGNGRATHPNLAISIQKDRWLVRRSFGTAHPNPTRTKKTLADRVETGKWVSWVVHAKWSPHSDGLIEIWKDGEQVLSEKGPNVYGTIDVEYTPYFKTGIYRPELRAASKAVDRAKAPAAGKSLLATDVKLGGERAKLEDFTRPNAVD